MAPQHLAVPYMIDATGSAATVDQDTAAEVAQCVRVLLSTPTGTRVEQMDYGIPDPTFGTITPPLVVSAIGRWEPRAAGARVTVAIGDDGSASITADVPAAVIGA